MHVLGVTHVYAPSMAIPTDIGLTQQPNEGYAYIARVAEAMGEDRWKRLAAELTDIGKKLKAKGIGFGYHNHNFEFAKAGNRTGYDIMVTESDPEFVSFELDSAGPPRRATTSWRCSTSTKAATRPCT